MTRELSNEWQAAVRLGEISQADAERQCFGERAPRPIAEARVLDAVSLLRGDAVQPEAIHWLWNGWLARGKLHIVAGAPGCGKSTLAIALAATLTIGGRWPDGSTCKPGNVIVWTGEDGIADTLLPRFMAMGGNQGRVWFVDGITDDEGKRPFDPAMDTGALLAAAQRVGDVGLLIVDPIVSAVAGDSHKNTETRRSLQPLVDAGIALDAAVLGISHYTKGTQGRDPIERVTGSIAFGALPRIIFGAAKSTDDDGPERLFVRAKSNIGPDGGGFGYELQQSVLDGYPDIIASGVYWGDALEGTARDLLGVAEATDNAHSELDDATDWLKAVLAEGRVATTELQKLAKQAGHCWRTVERAKKQAKAVSDRAGFGRHATWYWKLPKDRHDIDRQTPPQDLAAYAETRMNKGIQPPENGKKPHRPPTNRGGDVCADDSDSEAF